MRKVAFGAIPEAADFATELPLSAGSSRSQLSKQTTGFVPKPDDSAFCESRTGVLYARVEVRTGESKIYLFVIDRT